MKVIFYLITLATLLMLAACDSDTTTNPIGKTKLLLYYTSTFYKDTVSFGYDVNGHMTRSEGFEDRSTIAITGNQMHYIEYRKTENRQTADATFTLNAQGNVSTGQGNFSYNITSPYSTQFTFVYDGAGNLIKRTDSRSDGMIYSYEFTWVNDDITVIKTFLNGNLYLTRNIDYYPDLEDKIKLDWQKFLSGTNSYFGNSTKHLIKHSSAIFTPGTKVTQEYNFTYKLDADGFPVTSTSTGITTPSIDTITYYYQ